MFRRRASAVLAGLALAAGLALPLRANSSLFYFELQGLAGYSMAAKKMIFFSQEQSETMQKPGLGFDYVQRFSGDSGDFAVLAVQARLAWNADGPRTLEPQLYNAYLKFKMRPFDLWVGHERPKFGLASILDSHGLLLQPLGMKGFGFDRDWGVGIERQTETGDYGFSLTTGSGMDLRLRGNYFLSGRIGFGVLNTDNFTAGFSLGYGKLMDVMGYEILSRTLIDFAMAGADLTWLNDRLENRLEIMGGRRAGQTTFAGLWRLGVGLLDENRLKLEFQPAAVITVESTRFEFAAGAAFQANADWTMRTMAVYDTAQRDFRVVLQVYFYKGIRL